jgi:hypothetical protein
VTALSRLFMQQARVRAFMQQARVASFRDAGLWFVPRLRPQDERRGDLSPSQDAGSAYSNGAEIT